VRKRKSERKRKRERERERENESKCDRDREEDCRMDKESLLRINHIIMSVPKLSHNFTKSSCFIHSKYIDQMLGDLNISVFKCVSMLY